MGMGGGTDLSGAWVTDTDNPAPPPESHDEDRVDGTAVLLSARMWISSVRCDLNGAFRPSALDRALARCEASSPQGEDCWDRIRASLVEGWKERVQPFPLTAREKQAVREATQQCRRELEAEERAGTGTYCHIVSVDPCRRRVGVACDARAQRRLTGDTEHEVSPSRKGLFVEEHTWEPWAEAPRPDAGVP
jgi:hypothetical protein